MQLEKYKEELGEIEKYLAEPEAYAKPEFAAKSKRAVVVREIIELSEKIEQAKKNLVEAEGLVNDPELGEMAREDVDNLKRGISESEEKLEE